LCMMRRPMRALLLLAAFVALGCSDSVVAPEPHVARTTGGAVALSHDERVAVVTNRNAGLVTVFSLKPERGLDHLVSHTEVLEPPAGRTPVKHGRAVLQVLLCTEEVTEKGTVRAVRYSIAHR